MYLQTTIDILHVVYSLKISFPTNNATFVDVDLELTTNTLYSSATHLFLPMLRPFPVCVSLSSAPFSLSPTTF